MIVQIQEGDNSMKDTFYDRQDFYRMLEAGHTDLDKIAASLSIDVKILQRWKRSYDSGRGPFGVDAVISSSPRPAGEREDILAALRRAALEGNVPAAKLLLAEYGEPPAAEGEVLTVEKAAALIQEWHAKDHETI
jgi:hypothetical protein